MTYAKFLAESKRLQRKYIRDEQRRMAKASKLHQRYTAAMSAIGLHPLDRSEIIDRCAQLRIMSARVEETHGDGPGQRAAYDMHCGTAT